MTFTASGEGHIFTERTQRIINATKLNKASTRKAEKLLLLEGSNSIEAAQVHHLLREVFVTEHAQQRYLKLLASIRDAGVRISAIDDSAARKLANTVTSTGLFATCIMPEPEPDCLGNAQLVTVMVDSNDPGNAGTIIRLSDALGCDAVILTGNGVDPYHPKVVRASAGSIFHIPIVTINSPEAALEQLSRYNISLYATAPQGRIPLPQIPKILAPKSAWLFGSEAHGLPQSLLDRIEHTVAIPMYGQAESLNVSAAAAICLYTAAHSYHSKNMS